MGDAGGTQRRALLLPCDVPRLYFETDAPEPCPIEFGGPSDVLVYFLSLAFSTRYGSQHPLSQLALMLRREQKIDLNPLTTFADRDVEVEADQVELERVWQDAKPLAATLHQLNEALDAGDERISAMTAESPDLRARLRDLEGMATWAAERDACVRLSYDL